MISKTKKLWAMIVASVMLVETASVSTSVYAGDSLADCGDNLYTQIGGGPFTLSIGVISSPATDDFSMYTYDYSLSEGIDEFPWAGYRDDIEEIDISYGVTSISAYAFADMTEVETVYIPWGMSNIGNNAFSNMDKLSDVYYGGRYDDWKKLLNNIGSGNESLLNANVHCTVNKKIDSLNKKIVLGNREPRPGMFNQDVYVTDNLSLCKAPGNSVDSYWSRTDIHFDDYMHYITVYERWEIYMLPSNEYLDKYIDNERYNYRLVIDYSNSGLSMDEIKNYTIEFPNIEWDYEPEIRYDNSESNIYFKSSFTNGTDPHATKDLGEYTIDLTKEPKTFFMNDMSDKELDVAISNTLYYEPFDNMTGRVKVNVTYDKDGFTNIEFDLDSDGNFDVIKKNGIEESSETWKYVLCENTNLYGKYEFELSDEILQKFMSSQNEVIFKKVIFVFPDKQVENPDIKDEPKETDKKTDDKKENSGQDKTVNEVAKGTVLKDKTFSYVVTKAPADGGKTYGEVAITGLNKKNTKNVKIKSSVKINGITYKVTSIADNAFKGNKKIKKVTIKANIVSIGKKAFYGCDNLVKVTIKSKGLKKIGNKAFYKKKGKKINILVPKKLKKKYKKLLKKSKCKKYKVK